MSAPATDGRIRRGAENRRRISEAFLELVRSGVQAPTAEAVAEQAGVGLRSVFRHFEDMETLYREISEAIEAEVEPLWNVPFASQTWQGRLAEMIERRAKVFERITPFRIASMVYRTESNFISQRHARFALEQRQLMIAILPPHVLKDAATIDALDLVLSVDSWLRLRREQKLGVAAARAAIARAASALTGEAIG